MIRLLVGEQIFYIALGRKVIQKNDIKMKMTIEK